jgi:hypothetical protein
MMSCRNLSYAIEVIVADPEPGTNLDSRLSLSLAPFWLIPALTRIPTFRNAAAWICREPPVPIASRADVFLLPPA